MFHNEYIERKPRKKSGLLYQRWLQKQRHLPGLRALNISLFWVFMIFGVEFGPKMGLVFVEHINLTAWRPDLPSAMKRQKIPGKLGRIMIGIAGSGVTVEELRDILIFNNELLESGTSQYAALYIDKDVEMYLVNELLSVLQDYQIHRIYLMAFPAHAVSGE